MEKQEAKSSSGVHPVEGHAFVRYGVYGENGGFAGKTVSEIRSQKSSLWNIPSDAVAYVGREKVSDNYVAKPGDAIEFSRRLGEKG